MPASWPSINSCISLYAEKPPDGFPVALKDRAVELGRFDHQNSSSIWPHDWIVRIAFLELRGKSVTIVVALISAVLKTLGWDSFRPMRLEIGIILSAFDERPPGA